MIGDAVREFIHDVTGGNIYLILLGTFLIFYLDSMVITILPELLILFFYDNPVPGISPVAWLILLTFIASSGDVSGNFTVYLLFKKWGWFHKRVSEKLRKYVGLLVLKDEKLILLNRVAPALPMCGVFMAACNWNVKKSLFYIFIGGAVKYTIILSFFEFFEWLYGTDTAFYVTFIFVVVFLIVSFFLGKYERNRLAAKANALTGKEEKPPEEKGRTDDYL
jgi:hypothetical protein